MSTEVLRSQGNTKFKITTRGILGNPGEKSGANITKGLVNNGEKVKASGTGNKPSILPTKSLKRKPEESLDSQRGKKAKWDRTLKIHCGNILKELMSTQHSHIFGEPVDPVKLFIPDYFSVISKPMDLGTVKRKLEGNMYFSVEDFAADVKLTFSNAMTYNPEGNPYHALAKKMNGDFCRRWRLLEAKLKQTMENDDKGSFVQRVESNAPVAKKAVRANLENNASVAKKGVRSNMQGTKPTGLKKKSVVSSHNDKARAEVSIMDAANRKVKLPARTELNPSSSLRRTLQKEPSGQRVSLPAKLSQSVDSAQTVCFSCVSFPCHCRLGNGSTQPSTSDLSSERLSENNRSCGSRHDCEVKHYLASHGGSLSQEIDGPGVLIHEEKSPRPLTPAITVPSVQGLSSVDIQMSPTKKLRAAMLMDRFGETILKLTNQDNKFDTAKIRLERERLEREKKLEKAKIEEIRAAKEALRVKELNKRERERAAKIQTERAASRKALEEMKKTVNMYEGMPIMKDVRMPWFGSRILEPLGLFLKQEYIEEYDL